MIALTLALAAAKPDAWVCTFPGFSPSRQPVTVTYRPVGPTMFRDTFGLFYRVIRDNRSGFIAVQTYSEMAGDKAVVGGQVIAIDKATGGFSLTGFGVSERSNSAIGHCDRTASPGLSNT